MNTFEKETFIFKNSYRDRKPSNGEDMFKAQMDLDVRKRANSSSPRKHSHEGESIFKQKFMKRTKTNPHKKENTNPLLQMLNKIKSTSHNHDHGHGHGHNH